MLRALLLCAALAAAPALPARAQDAAAAAVPATLVADRIDFDRGRLSASGNVEVFVDGRTLRATRITYMRDEDRLLVEGPLTLTDEEGSILLADAAELSPDLRGSVLAGARLVLDQRLQIAAAQVATGAEGRYTELRQTVASSCEVCAAEPVPLWRIRARRIVHDGEARQLYFEDAWFDVAGIPVAWIPRMRIPDPTVERATGILRPRLRADGLLGAGIAVPYFITLGPSRDLTLTPFLTTKEARSLGFRYRQAFEAGAIAVEGAASRDATRPGRTRGYLFAEGTFALPRDYTLRFDVEAASDDAYLRDYDITDTDRLESRLAITKVDRSDRFLASITAYDTLREGERNRYLPSPVTYVEREHRVGRKVLGGDVVWFLQAHARARRADAVPPGLGLPASAARDVERASAAAEWRRSDVLGAGVLGTAAATLDLDAYNVREDPTFGDGAFVRAVPTLTLEARRPMVRAGEGGVRHVLEPTLQLVLAPSDRTRTPDEDSLTPEFDEGNLFSPQRFAGRDRREMGHRVNLGVGYTRIDPAGWQAGVTVGRVLRADDLDQFRPGTGLDGTASDWLVSVGAEWQGVQALQRTLVGDDLTLNRSETILRWTGPAHALETRFTYLRADALADRPISTSEWSLAASRDLGGDWTGRVKWRYDFVTDDARDAGLGLTYRSECVTVDVDVERRFTSSSTLRPVTRFGLGVELVGIGGNEGRDRKRRCGI